MEHIKVVTEQQLEYFSPSRDGQEAIPELVWRLIRDSCSDLTHCRIPYGDSIGKPGFDGFLATQKGFHQFVPQGESYWEVGTGDDAQAKATDDFKKRTKNSTPQQRAITTFVFVTSRSGWDGTQQQRWRGRRKKFGWKDIRILDGIVLADWLREFPATAKWLLKRIDSTRTFHKWREVAEHWVNLGKLCSEDGVAMPSDVFLIGRELAVEAVKRVFLGDSEQVFVGVEDARDLDDFVAAVVASQDVDTRGRWSGKCLLVQGKDEWHSFLQLKERHVIVADVSLELDGAGEQDRLAAKGRHGIIVPVVGAASGDVVRLIPPTTRQVEDVLTKAGFRPERVKKLVDGGLGSLSTFKRRLEGLPDAPAYSIGETARALALASLPGFWDASCESDVAAVERILGKSHGEWLESVRLEVLKPGTPLTQINQRWRVVARGEAWNALGRLLDDTDLARFQREAVSVLSEEDPTITVPKAGRWMASLQGKVRRFSGSLRKGLADTLALLGSRGQALSSCSTGRASSVASAVVRELLLDADWKRWMSLHDLLPLLAEASPDQFLEAVERATVALESSPFPAMYAQEGDGAWGWNYMSGLLWALETLAWHPDYLGVAVQGLASLASIDPGGKWANRPANSLTKILLPWCPQTTASIHRRVAAVRAVGRERPAVAWSLILSILPKSHGFTSSSAKPAWRSELMAGWQQQVLIKDYVEQVEAYASLAVELATGDANRLAEIVERVPELPPEPRKAILTNLVSVGLKGRVESERQPVWEALVDLAARHSAHPGAKWAMPDVEVAKVLASAAAIEPKSSCLRHRRLFGDRDFGLFEFHADPREQERRLAQRRRDAILEIVNEVGLDGAVAFASSVAAPGKVGLALGELDRSQDDAAVLPTLLVGREPPVLSLVAGFVHARWKAIGWDWVDRLPVSEWTGVEKATFFTLLPFSRDTWQRAEGALGEESSLYWRGVRPWPWAVTDGFAESVERLLQHGRPRAAVAFCSVSSRTGKEVPVPLVLQALRESAQGDDTIDRFDPQAVIETIKMLQQQGDVNEADVSEIEWMYLPLLEDHLGAGPRVLDAQLARVPERFIEMIRKAYKSEKGAGAPTLLSEDDKLWAQAAYRLLDRMRTLPGRRTDGTVDGAALKQWLMEVKRLAAETGHLRSAMRQIGHLFGHAASGDDWHAKLAPIAEALNEADADPMRQGFTTQIYNNRGVFSPSGGREERQIAQRLRKQADEVEERSLVRLARALRGLAESYEREAMAEERAGDDLES